MKRNIQIGFTCLFAILTFQLVYAQPDWKRVNYQTSSVFTGIVSINGFNAETTDMVGIFVGDECRMRANIIHVNGKSYVSAVIHVDFAPETAIIRFWDSQTNTVYDLDTFLIVQSHGSIKEFPIEIKSEEIPAEPTSVTLVQNTPEVKVFPSPFTNSITVSATKTIRKITIFNTIGNALLEIDNVSVAQTIIDTSSFASGFYLVQVELEDGSVVTEKLVKR